MSIQGQPVDGEIFLRSRKNQIIKDHNYNRKHLRNQIFTDINFHNRQI